MRIASPLVAVLFAASVSACGPQQDAGDGGDDATSMDEDGDGFTPEGGDCDDTDDTVYPGAPELLDDKDNDCDTAIDDDLPLVDDDGDGYNNVEGDCDDSEVLVNPGSVEVNVRLDDSGNVVAEGVDNDCDGLIDEGVEPCDGVLTGATAMDYAQAMELCAWVETAEWSTDATTAQHALLPKFGTTYLPHAGAAVAVLSTGKAVDRTGSGWVDPDGGTTLATPSQPHPLPQPDPADGCGQADPSTVNDYQSLKFTIKVPTNANSLAFDFNFMSAEFPQYVCSQWDDTFLAVLESESYQGNMSFDEHGRPVTINVGFFDVCSPSNGTGCTNAAELTGTGFEGYGGTGWLHSIAPVTPGETVTLTFHIFDEGDTILDSLVLLDNFQWLGVPVDGPITIDAQHVDEVHGWLGEHLTVDEINARL